MTVIKVFGNRAKQIRGGQLFTGKQILEEKLSFAKDIKDTDVFVSTIGYVEGRLVVTLTKREELVKDSKYYEDAQPKVYCGKQAGLDHIHTEQCYQE